MRWWWWGGAFIAGGCQFCTRDHTVDLKIRNFFRGRLKRKNVDASSWRHLQSRGMPVQSGWRGGVRRCPGGSPQNCCRLPAPLPGPCSFLRRPLLHCWSCREMSPRWSLATSPPACRSSSRRCSGCTVAAPSTSRFFCSEERLGGQWTGPDEAEEIQRDARKTT